MTDNKPIPKIIITTDICDKSDTDQAFDDDLAIKQLLEQHKQGTVEIAGIVVNGRQVDLNTGSPLSDKDRADYVKTLIEKVGINAADAPDVATKDPNDGHMDVTALADKLARADNTYALAVIGPAIALQPITKKLQEGAINIAEASIVASPDAATGRLFPYTKNVKLSVEDGTNTMETLFSALAEKEVPTHIVAVPVVGRLVLGPEQFRRLDALAEQDVALRYMLEKFNAHLEEPVSRADGSIWAPIEGYCNPNGAQGEWERDKAAYPKACFEPGFSADITDVFAVQILANPALKMRIALEARDGSRHIYSPLPEGVNPPHAGMHYYGVRGESADLSNKTTALLLGDQLQQCFPAIASPSLPKDYARRTAGAFASGETPTASSAGPQI